MSDVHEGGCVCGAVRYRVSGEPLRAYVCHCTYCQRTFSTAFGLLTWFSEENIQIDETLLSTYDHTVDGTDRWMRNHFCNRCGTTIMLSTQRQPGIRYIAVGTYDDPNWVDLKRQLWMRSAQRWVLMPECLERYERGTQHGPPMP
jgi:hypothetical protein